MRLNMYTHEFYGAIVLIQSKCECVNNEIERGEESKKKTHRSFHHCGSISGEILSARKHW